MGWARANIFYDKLAAPPEPGSLQEALCILIFNYREEAEIMRLVAEKATKPEHMETVFQDYMSAKAPYIKQSRSKQSKTAEEVLTKIFDGGPMIIDRRKQK